MSMGNKVNNLKDEVDCPIDVSTEKIAQCKTILRNLWARHQDFFQAFMKALMFSNYKISSVFSLIFFISCVHTVRRYIDKIIVIRIYCLSGKICREILFHIAYYYMTQAWFYFMKGIRNFTDYVENKVQVSPQKERQNIDDEPYDLRTILSVFYICIFSTIFIMTLIFGNGQPGRLQYFTWITGPRWVVTEMGSSARLLVVEEQIPRVKSENAPSYKSQRSASAEYLRSKPSRIPRYTQSELLKTNTSISDLIRDDF